MLFKYRPPGCDAATAYFAPWFIRDPKGPTLAGWEFDFSNTRMHCLGGNNPESHIETHHHHCFEGVLVKCSYDQHVWRLTGQVDNQGFFEGRWPD